MRGRADVSGTRQGNDGALGLRRGKVDAPETRQGHAGVPNSRPRVAIVHDWLVSPGGAEKVVLTLHDIWPEAPIYTAAFDPDKFPEFREADVRPTWLDKIPLAKKKHQLFSIPRAWAFMSLDLSAYDIVISSSSAESKYVSTGKKTLHICYCHTPIRYYWSDYDWYRQHPPFGVLNPLAKLVLPVLIGALRRMDYGRAQKVSSFIANSKNVQARIKKYYDLESTVIYPPIDVDKFTTKSKPGEYFLIVGRQVAYKRLDLAVDAFNELGFSLKVAGAGEEIAVQRARSKSNIEYLGRVSDKALNELMMGAKAFIFPPEEDFGMAPIEAMSAGVPVIAYAKGGALEYVVEGQTGMFFSEQTVESLVEVVKCFDEARFDPKVIREHAQQFSEQRFVREMKDFVDTVWSDFKTRGV